ncbi:hypothetical protein EVAR_93540_1 [Eumeta japonica]|uniref:Uncharacterized protein n=1 Tax=Eumeta variegata TaxID=151549 RepID=A0A4C1USD8_EUMVA|nr:hypothetical protein EVAR_93540_1 [Eumeta japonica]
MGPPAHRVVTFLLAISDQRLCVSARAAALPRDSPNARNVCAIDILFVRVPYLDPLIKYPILFQKAGNVLITLLKLRVSLGGGDHSLSNGSPVRRMRTGKRNRYRQPDSPHPNRKSKRDDISINQLA